MSSGVPDMLRRDEEARKMHGTPLLAWCKGCRHAVNGLNVPVVCDTCGKECSQR